MSAAENPKVFPNRGDGPAYDGMSLRDWFAGRAMQAMIRRTDEVSQVEAVVVMAYAVADAMLEARTPAGAA